MISTTKIIGRITATVEFEVEGAIYSSSILPLRHPDGSPDQLAISEYEEFIVNALGIFDEFDFEVVEEAESDRSYSMYYSLVKHDDYINKDYKYVLFVRISDHSLNAASMAGTTDYHNRKAEELKEPKSKKKQTWKFKEIVVNNEIYDSYDAALDGIRDRLANLRK